MIAHSKLGASSTAKWMNCAGSVRLETGYPSDESSPFAALGTSAHAVGEHCLENQIVDVSTQLGKTFEGNVVDEDMVEAVQTYVDYVNSIAQDAELFLIEQRVELREIREDMYGTSDSIIVKDQVCHVIDYKHGAGIKVDAFENTQGLYYAAGVYFKYGKQYNIKEYVISIVQPRMDNISEYRVTSGELNQWIENDLKPAVTATEQPDAPLNPSLKACQWCKAKKDCRALTEFNLNQALADFDFEIHPDMVVKKPDFLTNDEVADIYPNLKLLKAWVTTMEEKAYDVLNSGESLKGYKLVEGKANRQWSNEKEVELLLRKKKFKVGEIFTRKMISPTQAEKLLGKKNPLLIDYVVKPTGKPTIARESDKRPDCNNALSGFQFESKKD